MKHLSVLKDSVQKYMDLKGNEIVVDTTLGLGGHSMDILKKLDSGRLIAFDQDERNLSFAKERLKDYADKVDYVNDNFRYLKSRVLELGYDSVDKILFDLGLSSPHVDDASRGFSFMKDGPLDMRFDPRNKLTAEFVVNTYEEADLVKIFFEYGEEKMARKIADRICQRRLDKPFTSTVDLAEFLESILPRKRTKKGSRSHPATRVFQAIRIEVNDEFGVLREALEQAVEILKVGGVVFIITYHSLEDRIVKKFFANLLKPEATPEELVFQTHGEPIVEKVTRKVIVPDVDELEMNPRSRSAKLRIYKKVKEYGE